MIIAKNILERWNKLKEHNDIRNIAHTYSISRVTISNAFRSGRASSITIFAIDDYYKKKTKQLNKLRKV